VCVSVCEGGGGECVCEFGVCVGCVHELIVVVCMCERSAHVCVCALG
jgi:hypothetical protein